MSIRQTVVNLNPSDGVPAVRINQYDVGTTLVFVVLDGDEPAVFASGTTCTLQATRPSGTGYTVSCSLADNIVTVDTTIEMSREYGDSTCELRFVKGSTNVGTGNFKLGVEQAALPDGTIVEDVSQWNSLAQQVRADTLTASSNATVASQAAEDSLTAKTVTLAAEQSALLAARRAQDYLQTVKDMAQAAQDAADASSESEERLANSIDKTLKLADHPADAKAVGDLILHAVIQDHGLILTTGMG